MPPPMTPGEFETRVPVWQALSDLFLDTALEEGDHARIASVLSASPYSAQQCEAILRGEVAPVFGRNLYAVAGEWEGWGEADVRRLMANWLRQCASRNPFVRLQVWMAPRFVPHDWSAIAGRLS
ncbi:hypothetical protein MTR62_18190 [Novosphingobium sp. 1949]|uniref:DUF7079 domain-containing protein n=1 Tax=Novosphingobium organovorum TaxID=2930092 RepID=A0ABT0BIQ6_9SPHN|nr:hypothetical protein [Novosphingobium organovorum]MCJ2184604.1 hypothetical protein [Novosphingobium organovorum]